MGIWDTLTGQDAADASKAAAADQYRKQQEAAAASKAAGDQYQGALGQLSQRFDPYSSAGNSALQQLLNGLGLNGQGGSENFSQGYQNLPGYQSGLDTGTKAVASRLNAGAGVQSGAAMKALQRYGSDYENQRSGDYLTRLSGLSQTGLGATQAGVNTAAQGYGGQLQGNLQGANQMYGSSGTIGQGDVAAATAESQGLGNLIKLGMQGAGMFMGGGGGGLGGFGSSFGSQSGGKTWADNSSPYFMQGGNSYPMFR